MFHRSSGVSGYHASNQVPRGSVLRVGEGDVPEQFIPARPTRVAERQAIPYRPVNWQAVNRAQSQREERIDMANRITQLANDPTLSGQALLDSLRRLTAGKQNISVMLNDIRILANRSIVLQALSEKRNLQTLAVKAESMPASVPQILEVLLGVQQNNPGLEEFNLGLRANRLGDQDMERVARLTSVTRLDLGENRVRPAGIRTLSRIPNLDGLDLDGNPVGSEGARALGGLTTLTSLFLPKTNIGSEGVYHLRDLQNLHTLNLADADLDSTVAPAIEDLPGLTNLNVSANPGIGVFALQRIYNQPRIVEFAS